MMEQPLRVGVWDPFVRIFHWGLVASVLTAWLVGDHWKALHLAAGYTAAALIAFRIVWGVLGTPYARFRQFVRSPAAVLAYFRDILAGREARYIGHNPAGGAMIVVLLALISGVCFTGWLLTTDAFWGTVTMEIVHETLTNIALACVAVHVCGVVFSSLRHRENLVASMLTGRKRAPGPGDMA